MDMPLTACHYTTWTEWCLLLITITEEEGKGPVISPAHMNAEFLNRKCLGAAEGGLREGKVVKNT